MGDRSLLRAVIGFIGPFLDGSASEAVGGGLVE